MKIVADVNIPLIEHYFGSSGELVLKSGREIVHDDLLDADILLVRSITKVNKDLLQGTPVKFVGSVVTGEDHLDTEWLNQARIAWATSKGCNATAVVEYVISAIAALELQGLFAKNKRAGVVGVGIIGSQVVDKLKALGFDVLQYDPFRADEENFMSTSLEEFSDLDFITLHTPLTKTGKYPTYHMIGKNFLERQKPGCVLLNTSRGSVINFADLKKYGTHLHWCLDVWRNEPNIDLDVLEKALIATPHIAGYSVQSKYRGIKMIYEAALQRKIIPDEKITPVEFPTKTISFDKPPETWQEVILKIFNPMQTSQQMKETLLQHKDTFDHLRKNFNERYEFDFVISAAWARGAKG